MNNFLLFSLIAIAFFVGRLSAPASFADRENIVQPKEAKEKITEKNIRPKTKIVKIYERQNLKECDEVNLDDVKDFDFDEVSWRENHNRLKKKWDEDVKYFFQDMAEYPDRHFDTYKKIKQDLEQAISKHWEDIAARSSVDGKPFFFSTTFADDLKLIEIRKNYHEKLKQTVGNNTYNGLQKMISDYYKEQQLRASQGLELGPHISF